MLPPSPGSSRSRAGGATRTSRAPCWGAQTRHADRPRADGYHLPVGRRKRRAPRCGRHRGVEIAVTGGTGSAGAHVVRELAAAGHAVRVLSRRPPREPVPGTRHFAVDQATGSGLREALDDAEVVVDAMNSSKPGVLLPATRTLLDAVHTAGVGHYVGISIVGIERVPLGYYRAKLQQEEAIKAGPVAWSLLRATQFHSLIAALLAAADRFRVTPLPSARVQPVDPREVARELAARAVGEPTRQTAQLGGPEIVTLGALARAWRRKTGRRGARVPLPLPPLGPVRALRAGGLTDPSIPRGRVTFAEWLSR
ncbi:MAG: NAD-dependent epimerase/dehydratase family protein [Actinobacteria bacterium]|nr:MAG: NAD-dependent epimerase/dehydratase family protein [Actinomycetota bacterium]